MIQQIAPGWITEDDRQLSPTGLGLCPASAMVEVDFFGEALTVHQLCTRDVHPGNPLHVSGFASHILAAWVNTDEVELPSLLDPLDFKTGGELEALDVISGGARGSVCFSVTPRGTDYTCCRTDTNHKIHVAYGAVTREAVYAVWVSA